MDDLGIGILSADDFVRIVDDLDVARSHQLRMAGIREDVLMDVISKYPMYIHAIVLLRNLTNATILEIIRRGDSTSRSILARRRGLSIEAMDLLARDEDPIARGSLAWNAELPESLRQLLLADEDLEVREKAKEAMHRKK